MTYVPAKYDFLLPASDDVLLFDLRNLHVLRLMARPLPSNYVSLRTALARHLPAVDFELSTEGSFVKEDLIDGRSFTIASQSERRHVYSQLIKGYTSLVANEHRGDSSELVREALQVARLGHIDDALQTKLATAQELIKCAAATWALVPKHGNLNASNFVLTERGPILIDLKHLAALPFFYDALYLVLHEAWAGRANLLQDLRSGFFAAEMDALWTVAGACFGEEAIEESLLATLLVNAHHRTLIAEESGNQSFGQRLASLGRVL